ncbi:hypothetical protein OCAR_6819 [Afipia carboxidovorans OM5]|nr:hypothetical protein OCAR_6819 [Afipia carboxidovorans OM5]
MTINVLILPCPVDRFAYEYAIAGDDGCKRIFTRSEGRSG